ncbi:MAG: hypothetical protein SV062_07990 [Thermodesulfobacteriota bacterium]|nr:hypothetical protein [Thermodesulfobacteriota bacterium]
MNDHELGVLTGKLTAIENGIMRKFDAQDEQFKAIFRRLEENDIKVAKVETKVAVQGHFIWIVPTIVIIGLTAMGVLVFLN